MSSLDKIEFLKTAIKDLKSLDIPDLNRDLKLHDIGIDSLDAVELQMYYEERTGQDTKDPTSPVITVGDLIDLMP